MLCVLCVDFNFACSAVKKPSIPNNSVSLVVINQKSAGYLNDFPAIREIAVD
jgi:hypothetical protein